MNIQMQNGRVVIDGKEFKGRNISINGNQVIVDGVTQSGTLVGPINVEVHGDVENLECGSGKVTCGNVGSVKTGSGDVNCGNVSGSVQTGSGDVQCETISGSVRTGSGDVYHR